MKTALITGGSKGIGLAIKKELEKQGIKVISWSRTDGIDLDEGIPLKHILELRKVDILINNFGGGGTWKNDDFVEVMDRNYTLSNMLTREFVREKKEWGRVIYITSIYGTYPGVNIGFSCAKAAQIMLCKTYAKNNKGNITFNCVSPAEVADAGTPKDVKLKSEDVAKLVTFLCSDDARFINGQNIVIGEYYG